ncbi:hypothetical protein lacNasYZ03_00870 [Lactobacillus nasalidis]|uniref:Aggregation promoting factor n=1 Tax=Lactobacillus nasalidis TaxID=2797258 RepID=A0ABQ3W4V2_9LACO|nr:aggregation promoting factor [Lactobacillus nasalidis]GHV97606.1 hypothetical protein lacNasYZ01_07880 [Lactobacillus nasalidis]GHW00070.1 hypothetical protein lacNasYZ02_14990 [Lactobacillus nasalidis]GHW00400.1 hypothetical protein lacNasYZ03_00870 [Lactobacillus nasalidis]
MNIKTNVLKSVFAAGLALTGVAAISLGTNSQADAATIGDSVTVDYIDGQSIATWSNYHTATVTGSVKDGSSWRVVKTARDASGEKWYKIGRRQWILAKYTAEANSTSSTSSSATGTTASTSTAASSSTTTSTKSASGSTSSYKSTSGSNNYSTGYSSSANSYGYGSGYSYSYSASTGSSANTSSSTSSTSSASTSTTSSTSSSTSTSSSSEEAAKAWIANKESGGSYTASNGNYYGKYQLSLSYLNGDTSAANQEKVANSYVLSRYGSWTAAKAFWEANGWY